MLNINDSFLVVVDVQQKLAHLMHDHELLYFNIELLIKASKNLELPILWTEQAPNKIGPTVPLIQDCLSDYAKPIAKRSFSAWGCKEFVKQAQSFNRKQVILCGIETHVCIYQTASDLKQHGFEVFVVADSVSSRSERQTDLAIERMRQEGISIISGESLVCELIKTADHPKFKDVMAYLKK
jgi:nicotinamidase-related amidase